MFDTLEDTRRSGAAFALLRRWSAFAALTLSLVSCGGRSQVGTTTVTAPQSGGPAASSSPEQEQCLRFHEPYRCLGATAARPLLIARLNEDMGRGRGGLRYLGLLNAREAIPRLRELTGGAVDERVRVRAIVTLVEIGDPEWKTRLVEALRELEDSRFAISWGTVAEALFRLDADAALNYARGWMERHPSVEGLRDSRRAIWVAQVITRHGDETMIPTLARWGSELEVRNGEATVLTAHVIAARMALGERPFRDDYITALTTLDSARQFRPEIVLTGMGQDPSEVEALWRLSRYGGDTGIATYDAIDRLAPQLGERQAAGLARRLREYSDNRERGIDNRVGGELLARYHASMARLAHEPSRARLMELAARGDGSIVHLVAARHALLLDLPGAVDAAIGALTQARLRSRPGASDHAASLIDDLASRLGANDGRWAVGLLFPAREVSDRTLHHLSRLRPQGACEAVAQSVPGSSDHWIRPALLALTVFENACRPQVESLTTQPGLSGSAQSAIRDVLALMR